MTKILAIEDNADVRNLVSGALRQAAYEVVTAADGEAGLEAFRRERPDLLIMDVGLPKMDGFALCRQIRMESSIPILFLTGKGEEIDHVVGLEIGGDDYLTKPFRVREMIARVRALLRRSGMMHAPNNGQLSPGEQTKLQAGDLELHLDAHRAFLNGVLVHLTPREFDLLATLIRHPDHVFSRDALLTNVWQYDYAGDGRVVDTYIRSLRQKIKSNSNGPRITTVRGVGYRFEL